MGIHLLILGLKRNPTRAWRLFKLLVQPTVNRHTVLAIAITQDITEKALAELLADRFAPAVPAAAIRPAADAPQLPEDQRIASLCCSEITIREHQAALQRCPGRRCSPGADGVTYQMLRNLDAPMKVFLLEKYNEVLVPGNIPAAWLMGIVCPVLKPGKPVRKPTSYRPVSLTSAAAKLIEMTALTRLKWIADMKGILREQQSGFWRQRSTADSLADVISTFEQARHDSEVAYLLLLDINSAFDNLPHPAIDDAMDQLDVTGNLRQYIRAFLTNRSLKAASAKQRALHATLKPECRRAAY